MKHILTIGEKLFKEVECAAVVKNVSLEAMAEELLRAGISARESSQGRCGEPGCSFPAMGGGIKLCRKHQAGYTAASRPKATWPPTVEQRTDD